MEKITDIFWRPQDVAGLGWGQVVIAGNVSRTPEVAVSQETDQSLLTSENRYPHGHLGRTK